MSDIIKRIDAEFDKAIENGSDVRCFLYYPVQFLSERVKDYLDAILYEDAWNEMEKGNLSEESFVPYQDNLITVEIVVQEKKLETLKGMLSYFERKEEYEKCIKVKELLIKIENQNG
jgi:hypothetical protein